jgi:hypothetical protein
MKGEGNKSGVMLNKPALRYSRFFLPGIFFLRLGTLRHPHSLYRRGVLLFRAGSETCFTQVAGAPA